MALFHRGSRRLACRLERNGVLIGQNLRVVNFLLWRFVKEGIILLIFYLSHLFCQNDCIWMHVVLPKAFIYDFFLGSLSEHEA